MVNAGAGLDCWSSPHMDAEQRRQREFRERRREAEERRGWRGSARIHGVEARGSLDGVDQADPVLIQW